MRDENRLLNVTHTRRLGETLAEGATEAQPKHEKVTTEEKTGQVTTKPDQTLDRPGGLCGVFVEDSLGDAFDVFVLIPECDLPDGFLDTVQPPMWCEAIEGSFANISCGVV
jgi:hypothetical protein